MNELLSKWSSTSLILRISLGLLIGTVLGVYAPTVAAPVSFLGVLFVSALKAVAPLLVFLLVMSALAQQAEGKKTNMKHIIFLYLISTFIAALVAVVASYLFPTTLEFKDAATDAAPGGIVEVLESLLLNVVANPVKSLYEGNYIGILSAAVLFGIALRKAADTTKTMILDFSNAISLVVKWIIEFAPFGIMGLIFATVASGGLSQLEAYLRLVVILVSCMFFVALVTNPLIVFLNTKRNPYPLVFKCLKDSGVTAFFTRSSAANIPVNMKLCEELGLDEDTYAVSIPLGATINMAGAAITINILTLAAAHTLGLEVDILTALLLSVIASISACGVSGVAGGSLLLIPVACSLFNMDPEISAQVVGVGFVISVIQDSCETALNSSTDVLLTATADFSKKIKEGKPVKMSKFKKTV